MIAKRLSKTLNARKKIMEQPSESMKQRKLELLSPARNLETALAAIDAGADAVYMGFERFGARVSAGNTAEDIRKAVEYAHLFGVKVYVTMNTILYDEELEDARRALHNLAEAGVDALIVQDAAMPELDDIKLPLHASTQADCSSKEKVRILGEIGFRRVVLARELSIEEMADIHRTFPEMELEVFVHGALCCSFSGQCYMSEYLTGRSANRGNCCQACRSDYSLFQANGKCLVRNAPLLNMKDLNASSLLDELVLKGGAVSFKIEGRLKDVVYVKNITAYYSLLLDEFCRKHPQYCRSSYGKARIDFTPSPSRSFNRGFTIFNLKGKSEPTCDLNNTKSLGTYVGKISAVEKNRMYIETAEMLHSGDGMVYRIGDKSGGFLVNRVESASLRAANKGDKPVNHLIIYPNRPLTDIKAGVSLYRNRDRVFEQAVLDSRKPRLIEVKARIHAVKEGEREVNCLTMEAENGVSATVSMDFPLEAARNTENHADKLMAMLSKTGGTNFHLSDFSYELAEPYFFSAARINALRRSCIEQLSANIRLHNRRKEEMTIKKEGIESMTCRRVDYKSNISNRLAEAFFRRNGVEEIEPAYELTHRKGEVELMRSRNCIRYNLNLCLRRNKLTQEQKEDLYLTDRTHKYRLAFDCRNCVMHLYGMENGTK